MSSLREKAIENWEAAELLHGQDMYLNCVANRYYYALYQAARWRNDQEKNPISQITKKNEYGQEVVTENDHEFARRIIDELFNDHQQSSTYKNFKRLRITADYKNHNVKKHDLQSYNIGLAENLLNNLLETGDTE
jgi:hypothetical protein